jgi:hypothetical protein
MRLAVESRKLTLVVRKSGGDGAALKRCRRLSPALARHQPGLSCDDGTERLVASRNTPGPSHAINSLNQPRLTPPSGSFYLEMPTLFQSLTRNTRSRSAAKYLFPRSTITIPTSINTAPFRAMSASAARADPFKPAKRVAGQRQDVWYAAVTQAAD